MVPIEDLTGMNLAIEDEDLYGDKSYLVNKLTSLEATLVRNYDPPTYPLTYWQG